MRSECIQKVQDFLSEKRGAPVQLSEADIRRIDKEFLGEQQRMRREDPEAWAAMTTAERVTESAKRVMANKARETRQKLLTSASTERALVRNMHILEENANNYEGPGRYGQATHDLIEGIAVEVRGAEAAASIGFERVLTAASKMAEYTTKKGDAGRGLWLMFGSRKSDPLWQDVVRVIMGDEVESQAAKEAAKVWSATKESHRQLMNRNGGNIGYLDHFMEAMHNPRIMNYIGRDKWVAYWMKNGDWKRMQHPTGEDWGFTTASQNAEGQFTGDIAAAADAEKREFLNQSFRTLTEDGVNKTILNQIGDTRPGKEGATVDVANATARGRGSNLTKSAGHRTLFLKDAQAVIDYNKQFSDRSLGEIFMDSLTRTASDAQLVARAGANPSETLARILETAKKKDADAAYAAGGEGDHAMNAKTGWVIGAERKIAIDKAGLLARTPDHAFNTLFAPSDAPGRLDRGFSMFSALKAAQALLFTPVRAIFQDALQIRDHAVHTGAFTGLIDARDTLKEAAKSVADPETREALTRFGIALGAAMEKSREYGARLTVENTLRRKGGLKVFAENAATRAAQAQQKWSLLKYETDINRTAGEHINALALGDYIKKDWADLDPVAKSMLTRAGIQELDWHLYQNMPVAEIPGGTGRSAIDISAIEGHPEFAHLSEDERFRLSNGVVGFIRAGGDVTTSEFNFQAKMMTGAFGRTGTAKQLMLFKNAPVAQSINLARRMEHMGTKQRAMYMAGLIPRGYATGYMALATVAVLNGQQVPDPTDPKTALKCLLVSGNLSMVADMVSSALDPEDDSGHSSSLIPVLSDIQNIGSMIGYAATGETDKAGYRAVKFLRSQIPQLNYWYTKTAFNRLFFDDLAESMNPGYKHRVARYAEQSGTPYFWGPGQNAPEVGAVGNTLTEGLKETYGNIAGQ